MAENICEILDPFRQQINRPSSGGDDVAIKNLAVLYGSAQILKLDCDQWNQFCLSEHWRNHRNRPRPTSEDRDNALTFVLRYVVADSKASSLTKTLNSLLQQFWVEGVKAVEVVSLIIKRLETKASSTRLTWTIRDQPAARELSAITRTTSVTIQATVHQSSKGTTIFEVNEIVAREPLEPRLL